MKAYFGSRDLVDVGYGDAHLLVALVLSSVEVFPIVVM